MTCKRYNDRESDMYMRECDIYMNNESDMYVNKILVITSMIIIYSAVH